MYNINLVNSQNFYGIKNIASKLGENSGIKERFSTAELRRATEELLADMNGISFVPEIEAVQNLSKTSLSEKAIESYKKTAENIKDILEK